MVGWVEFRPSEEEWRVLLLFPDVGLLLRLSHVDCLVEGELKHSHMKFVDFLEILRHGIFTEDCNVLFIVYNHCSLRTTMLYECNPKAKARLLAPRNLLGHKVGSGIQS